MTVVVNDSYTDVDGTTLQAHVGELGATWAKNSVTAAGDNATIVGNRLRAGSGPGVYYASGTPSTNEYDVEAVFRAITLTAATPQSTGRYSTTAETGYILQRDGTLGFNLFKAVAGSFTQLGTFSHTATAGVDYPTKLQIRTAAKKVFVDTGAGYVERISSTDDTITVVGKAGVRMSGAVTDTTGWHIASFTATDLAAGGPTFVDAVAAINVDVGLAAIGTPETSAAAALDVLVGLAAIGATETTSGAALAVDVALAAIGTPETSAAALMALDVALAATGRGEVLGQAALDVAVLLTASPATAVVDAAATLAVAVDLVAAGRGEVSAAAALAFAVLLRASAEQHALRHPSPAGSVRDPAAAGRATSATPGGRLRV